MRVEVQFDGGAWTDISALVRDNYTLILRAASPDFHCATNIFSFGVNYDLTLYTSLRTMTKKALVRYYDDDNDLRFSGYFLPSTSFSDNGMLTTQTCSIEAQDFTELLRVPVGTAEDDDVAYLNYKILDSADPTHSITHALFTRLGLDTALIASGVLISGVVGAFASSSYEDDALGMLDTLMYEHGYVCNWDEQGYFRPIQWIIPEGSTPAFTFTDANIVDSIEENIKPSEFEGNEVVWYGLDTKLNTRLYTEDLPWDDEGNFDGYAVLPGFYYPPEANVIDDTTGSVQNVYQEYNDTGIRYKTAGRYVSEEYVMDFALAHADFSEILITSNHVVSDRRDLGLDRDVELFFNKRARIRYHNAQLSSRLLYYMHIDADVTYKKSQQKSKVQLVSNSNKLKSYESRFVFDKTIADALCKAQAQATIYGAREYSFTSLEDVAEGSYVALTLNSGVSATGLVVEKSYDGLTGIYSYQVAGFTAEYHAVTRRTVTLSAQPPLQQITQISNAPPAAAIQGVGDFHFRAGQETPIVPSTTLSLFPAGGAVFSSYQWYYTSASGIDIPISGAVADTFTVDYDADWFYADQVQVICRVDDKYSYTSYVTKTRDPDIMRAEVTGALTNISYDNGLGNPAPSGVYQFTGNFYLNEVPTVSGVDYAWQFGGCVTASGALNERYAYGIVSPTKIAGETYAQCTMTYSGVSTAYKRVIPTSQYNSYLDWNLEWDENKEAMYSGDIVIGNQVVAARVFAGTLEDDPTHPGYKRLVNGMAIGSNLQVSTPAGTQMYSGLVAVNNGVVTIQVGTDGNATFNGTITASGFNTSLANINDGVRITSEGVTVATSASGVASEGDLRMLIDSDTIESQAYLNGEWRTKILAGHPSTVSGIGASGQQLNVQGLIFGATNGFTDDYFAEYTSDFYRETSISGVGEQISTYKANNNFCVVGKDNLVFAGTTDNTMRIKSINSYDDGSIILNSSKVPGCYIMNDEIVYTDGTSWDLYKKSVLDTASGINITSISSGQAAFPKYVGNRQIIYLYVSAGGSNTYLYLKSVDSVGMGLRLANIPNATTKYDYVGNGQIIYYDTPNQKLYLASIIDTDNPILIHTGFISDICYIGNRQFIYCSSGAAYIKKIDGVSPSTAGDLIISSGCSYPQYAGNGRIIYRDSSSYVLKKYIINEITPRFQKYLPTNNLIPGATAASGLVPATSGVGSLGSATKPFSDIHLKEGGTINFDNGDAVITQSGNVVNLTGAELQVEGSKVWTAGNDGAGSGLAADTVPGYGIGIPKSLGSNADLIVERPTGIYTCYYPTVNSPKGDSANGVLFAKQYSTGVWINTYFPNNGGMYVSRSGGAWATIWGSDIDGNGGQPPAPKPNNSSVPGQWLSLDSASPGSSVSLPAGGTWAYSTTRFTSSGTYSTMAVGVAAGGTTVGAAETGSIWRGFCFRVA